MTGGNQLKLSGVVTGTAFGRAVTEAHARGAAVGGTSAGASILAEHMIAFGRSGATPRQRMSQLAGGLGLVQGAIVDQHFAQRNRYGRLLSLVAQSPGLLGIGVDEDTAAVVRGDSPGGRRPGRGDDLRRQPDHVERALRQALRGDPRVRRRTARAARDLDVRPEGARTAVVRSAAAGRGDRLDRGRRGRPAQRSPRRSPPRASRRRTTPSASAGPDGGQRRRQHPPRRRPRRRRPDRRPPGSPDRRRPSHLSAGAELSRPDPAEPDADSGPPSTRQWDRMTETAGTHGTPSPDLKIIETRVYRGPNIWSYDPAIHLVVDLGSLENFPSNTIDGFTERLLEHLPRLDQHHCSRGRTRRVHRAAAGGHLARPHRRARLAAAAAGGRPRHAARQDPPGQGRAGPVQHHLRVRRRGGRAGRG